MPIKSQSSWKFYWTEDEAVSIEDRADFVEGKSFHLFGLLPAELPEKVVNMSGIHFDAVLGLHDCAQPVTSCNRTASDLDLHRRSVAQDFIVVQLLRQFIGVGKSSKIQQGLRYSVIKGSSVAIFELAGSRLS